MLKTVSILIALSLAACGDSFTPTMPDATTVDSAPDAPPDPCASATPPVATGPACGVVGTVHCDATFEFDGHVGCCVQYPDAMRFVRCYP